MLIIIRLFFVILSIVERLNLITKPVSNTDNDYLYSLFIIRVFFVILSIVERLNLITKEVILIIIITDNVNYYSFVLCDSVYC